MPKRHLKEHLNQMTKRANEEKTPPKILGVEAGLLVEDSPIIPILILPPPRIEKTQSAPPERYPWEHPMDVQR